MVLNRRVFPAVVILLFVAAGAAYSQRSQTAPSTKTQKEVKALREDLDLTVQDAISRHRIPSMNVGLLDNGKVILKKAYGHDPIFTFGENNESNPYILGAVSQVLTGYAALILVGEGRLSLSDPLSNYIPNAPESWRSITIEQLLTHRSGLPDLPEGPASLAAAMDAVARKPLRFAPGTGDFNSYSDFDILGQVIEKAAGRSYMKFMHDPTFKRLKLALAGEPTLLTFRYVAHQDVRVSGEANLTRSAAQAAAGTMSGRRSDDNARVDTIRLMTRGIPEYSIPSRGLVGNVDDLLKIASAIGSGALPGVPSTLPYLTLAPGWKVCRSGEETLLMAHGMTQSGFGAIVDVIPSRKTGLVMLWKLEPGSDFTNLSQENEDIIDQVLAFPVADMTCGGKPADTEDTGDK